MLSLTALPPSWWADDGDDQEHGRADGTIFEEADSGRPVLVQGAGIAGLTMAIRLRQLGQTPVLVEQRDGSAGDRLATVVHPRVGGGHIPSMIGIRRTRLQDILAARAMELEADSRFGTSMAGFKQSPGRPPVSRESRVP